MGGLVLRSALNHPKCPREAKIGKIVLIAPPNKGSTWARLLHGYFLMRKYVGNKSGQQLCTKKNFDHLGQFPSTLKGVLIISGNFGFNPFIPGENDGTVGINETCLTTPHKHMHVYSGHKGILFNKDTFIQSLHFFENSNKESNF